MVNVKTGERLLHTFPVTAVDRIAEASDERFKKKALEAAANAKMVRNEELETSSARWMYGAPGGTHATPDACVRVGRKPSVDH